MKKLIISSIASTLTAILIPMAAFAHVVVTPNEADVAQELVFNVSVPNEKSVAVTNVKLLIPSGVTDVVPTAKDGWTIDTTKDANNDVQSISWSGSIPVGERQDFSFSAQVPGQAGELDWKAYQTYADSSVVHWDQKPAGSDDASGNAGPYSITNVTNDLTGKSTPSSNTTPPIMWGSYVVAGVALVVALGAFMRKK